MKWLLHPTFLIVFTFGPFASVATGQCMPCYGLRLSPTSNQIEIGTFTLVKTNSIYPIKYQGTTFSNIVGLSKKGTALWALVGNEGPYTSRMLKIDPTSGVAGLGPTLTVSPQVAVAVRGDLAFEPIGGQRLFLLHTDGTLYTVPNFNPSLTENVAVKFTLIYAGPTDSRPWQNLSSMAFNSLGDLYILDSGNNRILEIKSSALVAGPSIVPKIIPLVGFPIVVSDQSSIGFVVSQSYLSVVARGGMIRVSVSTGAISKQPLSAANTTPTASDRGLVQ